MPDDVAIVMPAYNAAGHLVQSLPAALAAADGRPVIVVDAGSTDNTVDVARQHDVQVIQLPKRAGPAEARNIGVDNTDATVVMFIDADCVCHDDSVSRVARAFSGDPDLVALTGSYDDDPPERNFASSYMNLRHHFTHQGAAREGSTFWAGCGAVRRDAFLRVGGFDTEMFPRPMIEDIELGLRLREAGSTWLDPELQVTHLKRWTLASVIHTDIFCRAIPWTRLIRSTGRMPNDLNLRISQRVAALFAPLALLAIVTSPLVIRLPNPVWTILGAAAVLGAFLLNLDMVRFFARRRGIVFCLGGWLFHLLHLSYSAATFVLCCLFQPRRTS